MNWNEESKHWSANDDLGFPYPLHSRRVREVRPSKRSKEAMRAPSISFVIILLLP
jgi:hypothetical protein